MRNEQKGIVDKLMNKAYHIYLSIWQFIFVSVIGKRFHSRGQPLCKLFTTKECVYSLRKEFNSRGTGLGHQHGELDVKWKGSII